jgi:hypothetical protein
MAAAGIDELDPLAAQLDGHAVVEGDVRHRRRALFAGDGALGVLVGDDDGRIGEDLAAG